MRSLKIYEAGKMSGLTYNEMNDWRVELKNKLLIKAKFLKYELLVVNPVDFYNFEEQRQQSENEIEEYDLSHVISSDVIVVNLSGLKDSIGTIIELHDAYYHNKIPVIAFGDYELYSQLHPWVKSKITRVEKNIDQVVDYIKDFYLIG